MRGRILLIDDSADDRLVAAHEIRRLLPEVSIEEIHDAATLAQALEAEDVSACIIDYQLCWTTGLEVLAALKQRYPDVPVLMFTNSGSEEVAVEAMKAGLDDYVLKSARNYRRLALSLRQSLERREERRARQNAEMRIQRLFERVPVGLFVMTTEGILLEVNRALASIAGHADEAALRGTHISSLFAAQPQVNTAELEEALAETREVFRIEGVIGRADGTGVWVELNAARASNHSMTRYEGYLQDITARKQQEATQRDQALELAIRARRKDEFIATLAHELRNPLSAISNAISLMENIPDIDGTIHERARAVINRQVHRLSHILEGLLDLSRVIHRRIELRNEPIELALLVRHAVETCESLVRARQHTLSVAIPEQPVIAYGDPVRLEQVMTNLLENAAKYTDPGGRIEVILEQSDRAVIRIRDNGMGIAPELLPRLFDLFEQGQQDRHRSQGGLGIGLSLVRHLVELHEGTIEALSKGPGQGSEFIVRLPVGMPEATAPPMDGESRTPRPGKLRILVVEDNEDSGELLIELLGLWGHDARRATNGMQALDILHETTYDVVLLDIGLPDIDGFEVARQVRARSGPHPRLIAMTGYGQPHDVAAAHQAGVDEHLTKPVMVEALAAALRRVTDTEVSVN